MTQPAVAADIHQTLDVLGGLLAEVALDLHVVLDLLADLRDLVLGQVLDPRVGSHTRVLQDHPGRGAPDPEDVGETDLDTLVRGEIDAGDSSHSLFPLTLPLLVLGVLADDPDDPRPADHLALGADLLHGRADFHVIPRSFRPRSPGGAGGALQFTTCTGR